MAVDSRLIREAIQSAIGITSSTVFAGAGFLGRVVVTPSGTNATGTATVNDGASTIGVFVSVATAGVSAAPYQLNWPINTSLIVTTTNATAAVSYTQDVPTLGAGISL